MRISDYLTSKLNEIPECHLFNAVELASSEYPSASVGKHLGLLVQSGEIARFAKGKFYKPKATVFGLLGPNEQEIMKDLLVKDGKQIGYPTGYQVFNRLGLTTQISWLFQIGCKNPRRRIKRGSCTIAFIKQNNNITESNVPLLQILDAIRYINKIPETSKKNSYIRLLAILMQLSDSQIEEIIFLSNKYTAATQRVLKNLLAERK
jgi:hypothetical protein